MESNWAGIGFHGEELRAIRRRVRAYVEKHPPDAHHGGIHGRTHEPDPAAVARLKQLMDEQAPRARPRPQTAAEKLAEKLAVRKRACQAKRSDDDMPIGQTMMNEELARALHARAVAGEGIQPLAAEAGYAHQNALRAYWRRMGLPSVSEARRRRAAHPFAAVRGAGKAVVETAVSEPERPTVPALEDVMVEPAPDDEPRPDWGPEVPAAAADEPTYGQEHTYPETAVSAAANGHHLAVLDIFDRRLASQRSLADELSEKGVRVRVSGRMMVELEF